MDIESVPGEIGILPEYREGYRNPPGAIWAIVGLSGKEKGLPKVGRAPLPSLGPNRTRRGGRPPLLVLIGLGEGAGARATLGCPFLLSTKAHEGPYGSQGVPVTSR